MNIPLNERKGLWGQLTQDLVPRSVVTCSTEDEVLRVTSSHIRGFAVNGNLPTSSLRRSKMVRMSQREKQITAWHKATFVGSA